MSRKEFVVQEDSGKDITLAIRKPLYEDHEESDKIYAAKVASLVRESNKRKILLRSEVDTFLRDHGIWSREDEKQIETLQLEIETLLNKLRKGGAKLSEGRTIAIEVMDKRKAIVKIMSKRQLFDDTTIESISENERNDYLIYLCTVYADSGKQYWDSFEDMKNDKGSNVYRYASVYAFEFIFNMNPEFEQRLPENKWLKKYGFIDKDLNYIDRKTGEKVDRNGNPLKKLEDEVMKGIANLQGDIEEETPFIDDETGEVVQS